MTVVCNINYDNICSGKLQEPDKKGTHREFKPPKTEQKKQPHHALHNDGGGWVQTLLVFWEYTAKRMWTHGRHTHSFCFYNSLYESLLSSVATNRVKLSWRLVRNDQLLYGCRVKKHPILLPQTQTAGTCPNIAFKIVISCLQWSSSHACDLEMLISTQLHPVNASVACRNVRFYILFLRLGCFASNRPWKHDVGPQGPVHSWCSRSTQRCSGPTKTREIDKLTWSPDSWQYHYL